MHTDLYFYSKSQNMGSNQMSFNKWMDKQAEEHP